MARRIGLEARRVDDREPRSTPPAPPAGSTMNRLRANRLCQAYSVMTRIGSRYFGIGAGEAVLDEQLRALRARRGCRGAAASNCAGSIGRLTAPQAMSRLARRLADEELVVRRAAGVLPGPADQRPVGGDHAFAAPDGLFVERGADRFQRARSRLECRRVRGPRRARLRCSSTTPKVRRPVTYAESADRTRPVRLESTIPTACCGKL